MHTCRENAFVGIYALFSDNKCPLFTRLGGGGPLKGDNVTFFYRFFISGLPLPGKMCDFPMNNPSWAEYQTSIQMPSWAEAPYRVEIVFLDETTIVRNFIKKNIG